MMDKIFVAGIVLYNPNVKKLTENIKAICNQVSHVLLVDNGSENQSDIKQLVETYTNVSVEFLGDNLGIAFAQNRICKYAKNNGYKWAITLDQDSVCPQNLVSEYTKHAFDVNVGMLCPIIYDINCGYVDVVSENEETTFVNDCLASASAIKISAWEEVNGFYEPMFIDKVDFEISYNLRKHGYGILRLNRLVLQHEIGHSFVRHFLFKDRRVFNHNYVRLYYMVRNTFVMFRRYGFERRWLYGLIVGFWSVVFYENDKKRKIRFFIRGILDGVLGKEGKIQL